jgi:hypothetical protein
MAGPENLKKGNGNKRLHRIADEPGFRRAFAFGGKRMNQKGIKLGVAWYRENQWQLLKTTASDPEIIEETYLEWLQQAQESIRKLKTQGLDPVMIDFDVNEFNDWCRKHHHSPDGESRSEYVALLLRLRDKYN